MSDYKSFTDATRQALYERAESVVSSPRSMQSEKDWAIMYLRYEATVQRVEKRALIQTNRLIKAFGTIQEKDKQIKGLTQVLRNAVKCWDDLCGCVESSRCPQCGGPIDRGDRNYCPECNKHFDDPE